MNEFKLKNHFYFEEITSTKKILYQLFFLIAFFLAQQQLVAQNCTTGPDNDNDGISDVCDLDNDNDGILDTDEGKCLVSLINGGFESPALNCSNPASNGFSIFNENLVPGWSSTGPTGATFNCYVNNGGNTANIEFWESGFFSVPSFEGAQFAEINAYGNGTMQQSLTLPSEGGYVVEWSAAHRGRDGVDVMKIGIVESGFFLVDETVSAGNTAWVEHSGTLSFTATSTSISFAFEAISSAGGNVAIGNFIDGISVCVHRDTDGDGTPDYLDTDSDNDGCSDAIEGAGSFTVANIQNDTLTGGVDANGIPLVAGASGQATSADVTDNSVQSADCPLCPGDVDTDMDGICDMNDLDDDNDGILDSDECVSAFDLGLSTYSGGNFTYATNNINFAAANATFENSVISPYFSTYTASTDYEVSSTINNMVSGQYVMVGLNATNTGTGYQDIDYAIYVIFGGAYSIYENAVLKFSSTVNVANGDVLSVEKSGTTVTYKVNGTAIYTSTVAATAGDYIFDSAFLTSSGSAPFSVNDITLTPSGGGGVCDADGDGTPDNLDLDSDGDGCPDAIEGAGSFTIANIQNDTLTGGVDANGVPIVAGASGQGTSTDVTDSSVQGANCVCTSIDTDMDGICDMNDLDDDNDGILDSDECSINSTERLGGFLATTGTTFVQKSGVVNNLVFPNSPVTQNGTYTYTDVRETQVEASSIRTTFFQNGQVAGGLGTVDIDADKVNETTISNQNVISNSVDIIDFDADMFTFTLQTYSVTGLYTSPTDINISVTAGSANLSAVTDLGGGVFQYTVTGTANHNTKLSLSSASGELIKRIVFTATDIPTYSGDRLRFEFLNNIGSCEDTDGDGILDYLDTDSDNDGCPDAIEGAGSFTIADIQNDTLTGGVNTNGVPLIAASGQAIGASQDSLNRDACSTIAENDINQTPQDGNVDGNVLTNDTDPTGDVQTVQSATGLDASGTSISIPVDGTATTIYDENNNEAGTIAINPDGTYTFDSHPDFTGDVPVDYVVEDSFGNTDGASLSIEVIPNLSTDGSNNPVIAQDDTNTTEQGETVTTPLLANDSDPDGDALTVSSATGLDAAGSPVTLTATPQDVYDVNNVLAGQASIDGSGNLIFTANNAFEGEVPVSYTATDGTDSDEATLVITVDPADATDNDTYANDDASVGIQDEDQTGNVLTNDNDPDSGDTQTVSAATSSDGTAITPGAGTPTTLTGVGTVEIATDGTYTFNPDPSFVGTEVIKYVVCDDATVAVCDTASLYLTTLATNETVAENDINQTPEGSAAAGNVLTNDTDAQGDAQTVQSATYLNASGVATNLPLGTATDIYDESNTLAGSMTMNADGSYDFTPATGYTGEVPVEYVTVDDNGNSATDGASLSIQVIPNLSTDGSNNDVIAQDDTNTTEQGGTVTTPLLANDSDPDGDALTVSSATGLDAVGSPVTLIATPQDVYDANNVLAGQASIDGSGNLIFTANSDFEGEVPVSYTATDGTDSDEATLVITVDPADATDNDTYANDDASVGTQGEDQTGNLLTNDNDPDSGHTQTVSTATSSDGTTITPGAGTPTTLTGVGTVEIATDGTYTFNPDPNFVGTEVIKYVVCDDATVSVCDTASLYLTTLATNETVAENDINQTPEGSAVAGNVLTNDTDAQGDVQTVQSATYLNASGVATNLPLGTATDIYDETNTLAGSMTMNADGTYDFTPATGYTGEVPVEYVAVDDNGNSATDGASLSIEVIPNLSTDGSNNDVIAQDDTNTTEQGGTVTTPLLANDSDPDGDALTVSSATGLDAVGSPVTLTATPQDIYDVNNVLAGQASIDGSGNLIFTANSAFEGEVPVNYTATDGTDSDDATLVITVEPVDATDNDTYANDDANVGTQDENQTGNVLTNDNDPDSGDTQTVSTATSSGGTTITPGAVTPTTLTGVGTVEIATDGTYTFNPDPNFVGTEVIKYAVCDDATVSVCDTASLYLTVLPVNTTASTDDFNNTPYETQVSGDVSTNDIDQEGNSQAFTLDGTNGGMNTADGTVTLNSDGSYTFVPANEFSGKTEFQYSVCDNGSPVMCDTATVYLEVMEPITATSVQVIANPDVNTVKEGQTGMGNVLSNDLDPDEVIPAVTTPSPMGGEQVAGVDENGNPVANAGTLTLNTNGSYTFVPTSGFTGTVTHSYTICDAAIPAIACDNAELIIDVIPDNGNTTFVNDDAIITDAGVETEGDVSTNDTDSEGEDQLITSFMHDTDGDGDADASGTIETATQVGGTNDQGTYVANAGSLTLDADGTYTFVPSAGFAGNVVIPYTACDNAPTAACDEATLVITVIDVKRDYGDAPAVYPAVWHRKMTDDVAPFNELDGATDVWLGTSTSFETSQSYSATAEGDSNDDAITFGTAIGDFPSEIVASTTYKVAIRVNSSVADEVFYGLWIDWDNDGVYEENHLGSKMTASPATDTVTITAPAGIMTGDEVNIRLRADDEALAPTDFQGGKSNGEVEDYQSKPIVLPVTLTSFNARINGCNVDLVWVTESEIDFKHFELEWSGNGQDFRSITSIDATGGNFTETYQHKDRAASSFNYYRLKMVDLDGSYEYSNIVQASTKCEATNEVTIYPNPVSSGIGILNVKFYSEREEAQLQITDMLGRIVKRLTLDVESEFTNTVQLDVSELPAGKYTLQLLGDKTTKMFIIHE